MNTHNENKNTANQTDFQQLGKVGSDNPEPGRHHGVFTGPGEQNLRQYGEHHYIDVSKDQEHGDPQRSHQDQRDQRHGVDSLQQGQHFGQHGSHRGQNDVNGVGEEYRGMKQELPGSYDKGSSNTSIHHSSAQEGRKNPSDPDKQHASKDNAIEELRDRANKGEFEIKEGKNWATSKEQSGV